jgi:hypothetical protein
VKVFPSTSGGLTEDVVKQVVSEFQDLVEEVARHISRVVCADIRTCLVDFPTYFVQSTVESNGGTSISAAVKTFVNGISFYLQDLVNYATCDVYFNVRIV